MQKIAYPCGNTDLQRLSPGELVMNLRLPMYQTDRLSGVCRDPMAHEFCQLC